MSGIGCHEEGLPWRPLTKPQSRKKVLVSGGEVRDDGGDDEEEKRGRGGELSGSVRV